MEDTTDVERNPRRPQGAHKPSAALVAHSEQASHQKATDDFRKVEEAKVVAKPGAKEIRICNSFTQVAIQRYSPVWASLARNYGVE
jgi:hypothetical protein